MKISISEKSSAPGIGSFSITFGDGGPNNVNRAFPYGAQYGGHQEPSREEAQKEANTYYEGAYNMFNAIRQQMVLDIDGQETFRRPAPAQE